MILPHCKNEPVDLDSLTRDAEDGAYHCPNCDAPFTRRSNLRRHFVKYTRNERCNNFRRTWELTESDALNCGTVQDTDSTSSSDIVPESLLALAGFNTLEVAMTPTSSSPSINLDVDMSRFFASLDAPNANSSLTDGLWTSQTHDMTEYRAQNFIPSNYCGPSSLESVPRARTQQARRNLKPYAGDRKNRTDRPIYTRRQVDDMLSAMSACYVGTIREVLRKAAKKGNIPSTLDFGEHLVGEDMLRQTSS